MTLQQLSLASLSFLLIFAVNNSFSAKLQCTKIDSCSCDWGNGSMTTLKDLALKGGEPKYKDVVDQFHQGLVYSYNPCYAFTEDDCKDVAVCANQVSLGQDSSYGTQDSAKFDMEEFGDGQPDTLTITYTVNNAGPAKNETRIAKLYVECLDYTPDQPFQVLGILPVKPPTMMMALGGPSLCPRKNSHTTPKPGSGGNILSVGSIIMIAFAAIVVLYVIGGIIIMKFVKKREGKEVFPNYTFWSSTPGYVTDGVKFIGNKVRGKNDGTYGEA